MREHARRHPVWASITSPFAAGLAVTITACTPASDGALDDSRVAFVGVSIIDVENGQVRGGQTVIVAGTKINAVGPDAEIRLAGGTRVVAARGRFLILGLWDTHVHLTPFGADVLPVFVAYGVTAVRDAGSSDSIFRWREAVAAGARPGPRIWSSGPMLRAGDEAVGSHWEGIDSPESARQAVARRKAAGSDFLKIQDSFLDRASWTSAAAEAGLDDLPVLGHAPVDVPLTEAMAPGLRSNEHTIGLSLALTTLDSSRLAAVAAEMRELNVALSPNLTDSRAMAYASTCRWDDDPRLAVISPAVRETWRRNAATSTPADDRNLQILYEKIPAVVDALHRAGVTILAGSDAWATSDFPGSDLHSELHLVQAGLTPLEVLRTATLAPARFLNVADWLGSIRAGMLADLVLLDANPLEDITHTERIAGVMANGRWFDRAALDTLLGGARRAASSDSTGAGRK